MTSVSCDSCTFGFAAVDPNNAGAGCTLPRFAPWHGWDATALEHSFPLVLHLRERVSLDPPALVPRKDRFVGYANFDYAAIRYSLDFPEPVDLDCTSTVTRSTTSVPPIVSNGTAFDRVFRSLVNNFVSRPADLRLEVTTGGNFTFDACDSLYTVSLTLFHADTDGTVPLDANESRMVSPDRMPSSTFNFLAASFPGAEPWTRINTLQMVWASGCEMSASAKRTVFLTPGKYVLRVRGNPQRNDISGTTHPEGSRWTDSGRGKRSHRGSPATHW